MKCIIIHIINKIIYFNNVYTTCEHLYCKDCIVRWLSTHDNCPCCRANLEEDNLQNIV